MRPISVRLTPEQLALLLDCLLLLQPASQQSYKLYSILDAARAKAVKTASPPESRLPVFVPPVGGEGEGAS